MKKAVSLLFVLLPVIIAALYLLLPKAVYAPSPATNGNGGANGQAAALSDAERLLFLLQYISVDYNGAVQDGEIIDPNEYTEMREFCEAVAATYRRMPAAAESATVLEGLRDLQRLIADRADWSTVRTATYRLIPVIARQFNVVPYPLQQPDLVAGRARYVDYCADCHGMAGDGRGPSSAELIPPPSNFNDAARLLHLTPYQFYNAMTFGVEGTAMASFSDLLSPQDRWDIAFYLMTIKPIGARADPPKDAVFTLRELATTSNAELAQRLANRRAPGFEAGPLTDSLLRTALADVELLRRQQPRDLANQHLAFAREKLQRSFQAYEGGDMKSSTALALDAYLHGIEGIEIELRTLDSDLSNHLERECAEYRAALAGPSTPVGVRSSYRSVLESLDDAEAVILSARGDSGFSFLQAMTIILREGIEAALVLGLMITYLASAGYKSLRRHVAMGGAAGVVFGLITWGGAQTLIESSVFNREALEGLASLLAAGVLFSISLWVIHHADVRRWKAYIQSRAESAISTGSKLTLIVAAFLAVYREAFETVLFYQVLWMRSPAGHGGIVSGFLLGAVLLIAIMAGIFRFGMRIPLRPFFAGTGLMLGALTFVFAGYGIRELQNIGWVKTTPAPWDLQVGFLEIHPTVEGTVLQLSIVMAFLLGWIFTRLERDRSAEAAVDAV